MPRRDPDPDFIESIARGFDVVKAFDPHRPVMSLSEVATAAELARPTARRILRTLETLGYVRTAGAGFALTPRVLELGLTYVQGMGLWETARPHMEQLVAQTHESSSLAQLDGSDIVYVGRVAVPKIITLAVQIGTRFPAPATSMGRVLLADLDEGELESTLSEPSRAGVVAKWQPERAELDTVLRQVRARSWALADEDLAPGIRSIAAPLRDGAGRVVAAMNVTVHAAETSVETLTSEYLPLLREAASGVSAELALYDALPRTVVEPEVS